MAWVPRSNDTRRPAWTARRSAEAPRTGAVFMLHPFQLKSGSGISSTVAPVAASAAITPGTFSPVWAVHAPAPTRGVPLIVLLGPGNPAGGPVGRGEGVPPAVVPPRHE